MVMQYIQYRIYIYFGIVCVSQTVHGTCYPLHNIVCSKTHEFTNTKNLFLFFFFFLVQCVSYNTQFHLMLAYLTFDSLPFSFLH